MYSNLALKIFAAISEGVIKSRTMFWRDFSCENIEKLQIDVEKYEITLENADLNVICCFDEDFPRIFGDIKQTEKPFLFVYRGDISLIGDITKNVAVIGCLTPDEGIEEREVRVVKALCKKGITIVSGLARGCDTIAHKEALDSGGKTIAFLPTSFDDVFPSENANLLEEIVHSDGLVISEYVQKPQSRGEKISRFIERDRLQTMFSMAVILIASYRQGEGDSGSRHAMKKAKVYGRARYVMFNRASDEAKATFGLNEQMLADGAVALTGKTIGELFNPTN